MNSFRLRALRGAAALVVALLAGPGLAAAPVWIGVGAPLSGPDARYGDQVALGVERAIADANADGGFLGRSGQMMTRDDGADPKRGVEVAKSFVADKVAIVVGHFSSAVTVPASAVYAGAGVLDITPAATAPLVTDRGLATVFRTCGREDEQAGVAARYLRDRFSRVAIVFDRTSDGKALADGVRAALASLGEKDVFYGSFAAGSTTLAALVQRMKAAGAQAVFVGGGGGDAGALARQIHDANAHIVVMGGFAMAAAEEFAAASGPAADGSLIVFPRDPRTRPAAADLLRRLTATGQITDAYVFYAYAAVQVIRQAAQRAGSLDAAALARAMHSGMTFSTVLGDFSYDDKGDPVPSDLAVYVWHRGATGRMGFDDLARS